MVLAEKIKDLPFLAMFCETLSRPAFENSDLNTQHAHILKNDGVLSQKVYQLIHRLS